MVYLEMNRDHSVIFEIAPKYCILDATLYLAEPEDIKKKWQELYKEVFVTKIIMMVWSLT